MLPCATRPMDASCLLIIVCCRCCLAGVWSWQSLPLAAGDCCQGSIGPVRVDDVMSAAFTVIIAFMVSRASLANPLLRVFIHHGGELPLNELPKVSSHHGGEIASQHPN